MLSFAENGYPEIRGDGLGPGSDIPCNHLAVVQEQGAAVAQHIYPKLVIVWHTITAGMPLLP